MASVGAGRETLAPPVEIRRFGLLTGYFGINAART
jgi:hypothetical protein